MIQRVVRYRVGNSPVCCLLALLACGVGLAGAAHAQTSFVMLGSTYPTSVERGKTSEVTISASGNGGANLYGAYKVLFEGTGVTGEIIPPEKGWPAKDPKNPWALPGVDKVKMRVTVAPDVPPGIREYRIATPRMGVSTIGLLIIGDEPEIVETEPNNDLAHAQKVTVPCVVNGRFQDGEDVDTYKFSASAGQEVVFSVFCARLEDKVHDLQTHADPLLILRDSTGKELARNDDYYRADPMLPYKFDKDGDYIVQIRDVNYGGNGQWVYSLEMTRRPYVTAVLPCAVRPGQSVDLRVVGYNLGEAKTVHLDVPPATPTGIWQTPLKFANGVSNPVSLLVTDAPQIVAEPETARAESGKVVPAGLSAPAANRVRLPIPGGVNSWLTNAREVDRYPFHARKGEAFGFEVTSRRLDSEMDSQIKIRNAKGDVQASNDDAFGKDSRIDWTASEDGDYTVEVSDVAGHSGPTRFYNLTAQPLRPDFAIRCDPDRAMIAPGNRTSWYVTVERKYGFSGPVTVDVKGLPSGVTASPLTIPANMTIGTLILSAASDAKIDVADVKVTGTAPINGADGKPVPVTHRAVPLAEIYIPGGGRGQMEAQVHGVAVTESNDLEVSANTQQITLAPGGTAKVEITIKRRPDYNKPVSLDFLLQSPAGQHANPLPPGVTVDDGASKTLLNEKETTGYITLRASPDAQPVTNLPLAPLAYSSINFVMRVWFVAQPISLTVTPQKK